MGEKRFEQTKSVNKYDNRVSIICRGFSTGDGGWEGSVGWLGGWWEGILSATHAKSLSSPQT